MVSLTVGNRLDQHWHFLFNDDLTGSLCGEVNREEIITVDSDRGHAVAHPPDRNTITGVLVIDWGGNRVHVVSAVE